MGLRSRLAVGGGVLLPIAVACAVPSLDLSTKRCQSADDCPTGQRCFPNGACAPPSICDSIPHFPGTQTVDGRNDDFAGVPVQSNVSLTSMGPVVDPVLTLDAQVAWSAQGLHLFFHVAYQGGTVLVPGAMEPLWYGDGIELFLKGDDHLTGAYGGPNDPGAVQIVITPDVGPVRSAEFDDDGADAGTLPAGVAASRRVPDGYDLELLVPWTLVGGAAGSPPSGGSRIGFDLAVDCHARVDGGTSPQYQLLLYEAPVEAGPVPYCGTEQQQPHPSCDDLTWCRPTLLAP